MRKKYLVIITSLLLMHFTKAQTVINFITDTAHVEYFNLKYSNSDSSLFKIEHASLYVFKNSNWELISLTDSNYIPQAVQMIRKKFVRKNYVNIAAYDKRNPAKIVLIKFNRREYIFTQIKNLNNTFVVQVFSYQSKYTVFKLPKSPPPPIEVFSSREIISFGISAKNTDASLNVCSP